MREASIRSKDLIDALSSSLHSLLGALDTIACRHAMSDTQREEKRRRNWQFFGSSKFMRICPCHDRKVSQKIAKRHRA